MQHNTAPSPYVQQTYHYPPYASAIIPIMPRQSTPSPYPYPHLYSALPIVPPIPHVGASVSMEGMSLEARAHTSPPLRDIQTPRGRDHAPSGPARDRRVAEIRFQQAHAAHLIRRRNLMAAQGAAEHGLRPPSISHLPDGSSWMHSPSPA